MPLGDAALEWLTGAQPPLRNPGMCEESQALKRPQQRRRHCVEPLSPLQSANTVTEAPLVFKVAVFGLEWRAVWTESCSHGRAQGQ